MTTDSNILAHKQLKKQPPGLKKSRRTHLYPDQYDPWRELLIGVANQALIDAVWPAWDLPDKTQQEAIAFMASEVEIFVWAGIPVNKYLALWEENPQERIREAA